MGIPFSCRWAGRGRAVRVLSAHGASCRRAQPIDPTARAPVRPRRVAPPHPAGRRSVTSQRAARRCRRGRLGAQRPGRRADARSGGSRGGGLRGGADDRRGNPDPGPHPRGLPARRVLGGASSAGGLSLLPLARPGRPSGSRCASRKSLSPTRSVARGRPRCTGTSARRPPTSAVTPRPTGTWWARWWTGWTASCPTSCRRCAACRATRWRSPASRWSGRRRCTTRRAASRRMRRAPSWPARRHIRWSP